ncbi:MAG: phosphatidylserine/phosphatidylglycerophosphate/cardiolipin synthase family protein [Pseudomonadota bacterium]|nr:phosphatidylserine/phosphatidylglycerophosphate/cardiolipin synthase family protein [Pseudomonadota bacterium]
MKQEPAAEPEKTGDRISAKVDGTRLDVLCGGAERLEAILGLIGGAQTSVRLLFYIFSSDNSGTRVRDALVEAAERGVKVKVLLDGYGCSTVPPGFFQALGDAGVDFCLFHPAYGRRYLLRNHQKLVIADEQKAIIGGANIQDGYMQDEGPLYWRDLWLLIDGPIVPAAAGYFDGLYGWTSRKGAKLSSLRRLVHEHSQFRGPLQWKFSGPLSIKNAWRTGIVHDMRRALSLDLIAAYFSPPRAAIRRLGRLAKRGRVRIITAAMSDNNATIGAARDTYSRLLRRGVEMYEYQPARLHTKLAMCDDIVYIGSANFDFRSLYINLEVMLRIKDADFAAKMRRYFETERAASLQITPELHQRRATVWRRLKWRLSHWLVTSMDYTVTRRLNFRSE